MKPIQTFSSAALLMLSALVGCNLHSGSGLDPDEILEGGAGDIGGDGGGSGSGSSGGGGQSSSGSGGGSQFADAGVSGSSSGGNQGGNSSGGSGSGSGGGSGGDGVDAGTPPPADGGSTGNPGECPANPSTCIDCCGSLYPSAYQAFLQGEGTCLCGSKGSGVCASACQSELCIGSPYSSPNDACETCVNDNSRNVSCVSQGQQTCKADPNCGQFFGCFTSCPANSQ